MAFLHLHGAGNPVPVPLAVDGPTVVLWSYDPFKAQECRTTGWPFCGCGNFATLTKSRFLDTLPTEMWDAVSKEEVVQTVDRIIAVDEKYQFGMCPWMFGHFCLPFSPICCMCIVNQSNLENIAQVMREENARYYAAKGLRWRMKRVGDGCSPSKRAVLFLEIQLGTRPDPSDVVEQVDPAGLMMAQSSAMSSQMGAALVTHAHHHPGQTVVVGGFPPGSQSMAPPAAAAQPGYAPAEPVPQPSAPPQSPGPAAGAKFCTACGTKLDGGAKFCAQCGKKQVDDAPPTYDEAVATGAKPIPFAL